MLSEFPFPWLNVKSLKSDMTITGRLELSTKSTKYLFDKPLLLIGEDGANLLARTKPIAFMARGQYWVNNHAHVLDGLSETLLEYIALFINSISPGTLCNWHCSA